ncbi:response regulator transcription factor [Lysobacter terrae]
MHILIVESEPSVAMQLGDYLEARGHCADYAALGTLGWHLAKAYDFDAIILSHRNRLDALTACRKLRQLRSKYPAILLVGDECSIDSTLAAFEAGADDYMARPVAFAEIHARLSALTRRRYCKHHGGLAVGDLVLDVPSQMARRAGRRLELTPTEFKLLRILMEAAPAIVTYSELELCLWGGNRGRLLGTNVRSQIYNLREVVDRPFDKPLIQTCRQLGYRLVEPDKRGGRAPYQRRVKARVAVPTSSAGISESR